MWYNPEILKKDAILWRSVRIPSPKLLKTEYTENTGLNLKCVPLQHLNLKRIYHKNLKTICTNHHIEGESSLFLDLDLRM